MINCQCFVGYFFTNILLLSGFSIEPICRWNCIKGGKEVEPLLSGDVIGDNNRKRLSCYKIFEKYLVDDLQSHSAQ